jgi:chromosomal replication initiation ATPase DnaA
MDKKMKSFDSILENYNTICGEYNHEAIMAVKSLLEEGKTNFSPLIICGDGGVGKTHILKVARAFLEINGCDNNSIIYFANKGLCKFLNNSLNNNEFHKSIDFDSASIIILDDVHEYAHMVRTQEYFLDIISKSKELNIPIIVAGNNHSNTMPNGFNPNLLSRLGGGVAVRVDVPDVKSKASFIGMLTKTKGIILEPKIEQKVIGYFGNDFSILQGVINRFELFATVNKNTVIDNVVFNLIFKDEINHFETPVHRNGESV